MIYKIMVSGGPDLPPGCDDVFNEIDQAKAHVQDLHSRNFAGLWVEVTDANDEQLKVIEDLEAEGWL